MDLATTVDVFSISNSESVSVWTSSLALISPGSLFVSAYKKGIKHFIEIKLKLQCKKIITLTQVKASGDVLNKLNFDCAVC